MEWEQLCGSQPMCAISTGSQLDATYEHLKKVLVLTISCCEGEHVLCKQYKFNTEQKSQKQFVLAAATCNESIVHASNLIYLLISPHK